MTTYTRTEAEAKLAEMGFAFTGAPQFEWIHPDGRRGRLCTFPDFSKGLKWADEHRDVGVEFWLQLRGTTSPKGIHVLGGSHQSV
jgi:hypothetical protein